MTPLLGLTVTATERAALSGAALEAHAANELNIISSLSPRDRNELTRVLRRLHLALDRLHQNAFRAGVEPTSP